MTLSVAYLSQGKLFLKLPDASLRTIESEFGQTIQDRTLRMKRNKSWKDRGIQEMMLPPGMLAMMSQQPEAVVNVAITSLCNIEPGQLLYALEAGEVGGIFTLNLENDRENRLFHNSEFQVGHLDYNRDRNLIACTVTHRTGISNIATMPIDGLRPNEVTEGDSIDLAPRWIPGKSKALVYQSAGVGRTSDGYIGDRTPFSIEKLDFDKQEVTTLAQDPKSDLMAAQIGTDGLLYYIRRPYRPNRKPLNILQLLKDIVLFPLRLAYAILQWLNFFSMRYTGKPLTMAGTKQTVDEKQLKLWGESIAPEKLRDRNFSEADAPSLVPRTWQLVRQATQGVPEVLAEGVLAYDLALDGTIIYTNGSAIYAIRSDGSRDRLCVGNWIESVSILETDS